MTKLEIQQRLSAVADRRDVEILFPDDYGISEVIRTLAVSDWIIWDADNFSRHVWHAIAWREKMWIATKKHKHWSAYVIMRIA